MGKPDGLTVLSLEGFRERVWPRSPSVLNGIGPKASERLEALGITTLGQLAQADPDFLVGHFGRGYGAWLKEAAQGRDDRPVVTERDPKSVSRETTFERDLHPRRDREALTAVLLDLCRRLSQDLERKARQGRTIGVKVRFDDFRTLTRDLTLEGPTADADRIRDAARACLRRVPLDRPLRLLGIRVGGLVALQEGPVWEAPRPLFGMPPGP
jgi:DNA polymerase-4